MKHNIADLLAAWVLAIALVAAIAVVNTSSHRDHPAPYLDVSRPPLLLSDPSAAAMPADRDEPLVDRYEATMPSIPEPGSDALADHPAS